MAGNNFKKSTGNINSSWMRNALKSLGMASTDIIKDMIPATAETFSSASKLAQDTARTIRSNRVGNGRIGDAIKTNPAVKLGQDFLRNAAQDLKSGKIYNTERMPEGDDWDFGEDFSFGDMDDESLTPDVNINTKVVNVDNSATIKVMEKQMDYQIKSTKATIDTMVAVGSASLAKTAEIGSKVLAELGAINSNLAALVEYNSTNMTRFIEASIGYYEQNSKSAKSSSYGPEKVTQDAIFGAYGGLDFGAYKEYVKNNIKAMKDDTMIGSMVSMILDNKDMLITNPLGMVLKGVMENVIPETTKEIMTRLDETVQNSIPILLERIGRLGENDTSNFAVISRFISKAFGIKSTRETKFDYKKIEKGPIPFNGYANHSIVEVIPKYLRESTEYLRVIAEHVTGMPASQIRSGSSNFNWQTGRFEKLSDTQNAVYGQIRDEVRSVYQNSTAGKSIQNLKSKLTTQEGIDAFDAGINQLYDLINAKDNEINFKSRSQRSELINQMTTNREVKKLMEQWMSQSPEAAYLNAARILGRNRQNQVISRMNEDRYGNNLAAVDGLDYDEWVLNSRIMGERGRRGTSRYTNPQNSENLTGVNALLAGAGNVLRGIASGNTDAAWDSFGTQIGESFSRMGAMIADNFLKPISDGLFGQKNDQGYLSGGVFSSVQNTFREQFFKLRQAVTGQGYVNARGDTIADLQGAEMQKTLKGRIIDVASWMKDAISTKLFGDADYDYNADPEVNSANGRHKGLLGELRHKLTSGETSITAIIEDGAKKFNSWLFGEEIVDEDGNRTGERKDNGLISKKAQDYLRKNGKAMGGGAAVGAVTGMVTGGGLLGALIGGPLAGAITGTVGAMVIRSEAWQKFMYGNPETGDVGLKQHAKDWMRKLASNSEGELSGGKLIGGSAGTILAGGALGMLVGMPVVGAAAGLGTAILAQGENFKKWLFGEDILDEDGNKIGKKHGIVGQFGNMLNANVFQPIITHAKHLGRDLSDFMKYDVLYPASIYIGEIGNNIFSAIGGIAASIKGTMTDIGTSLKETFVNNIVNIAGSVLSPLVSAAKVAGSAIVGAAKTVISTPVKLLGVIASPIVQGVSNAISTVARVAFKSIDTLLVKPVNALILKPLGGLLKIAGNAVAAPFKLVGGIVQKASDAISDATAHVAMFITETGQYLKSAVINSAPVQAIKHGLEFVHEVAVEAVSPLVEIGKAAIGEVKNAIKNTISGAIKGIFNLLNPMTWFRAIGRAGKGLGELIFGSEAMQRVTGFLGSINPFRSRGDGERPSLLGTLGDIWRRTGDASYRTNAFDTGMMERDADGNVISRLTWGDKMNALRANRLNAAKQRRQLAREEDAHNANAKLIAKYTKNQYSTDTVEAREVAERMAAKAGVSLKDRWKGEAIRSPELVVEESIDKNVALIAAALTGRNIRYGGNKSTEADARAAGEAAAQSSADAKNGRRRGGLLGLFRDAISGTVDQADAERNASNKLGAGIKSIFEANRAEGVGGFFKSIRESINYGKAWGTSRKNARNNIPGYADGTDDAAPGAAIVGEEGPELINMVGGEQVIPLTKRIRDQRERARDAAAARAFSLVSGRTSESEKARIDEMKEKEENARRQEEQTAAIKDLTAEQKEHHSIWDSIFSKKGLITGALLLGLPLAKNLLEKLLNGSLLDGLSKLLTGIGESIWNKITELKDHFEWIFENGALGDAKNVLDKISDHITEACVILTDVISGQPMNALAEFLFDENGNADHQTGARLKFTGMSAAGAAAGLFTKAGRAGIKGYISEGNLGRGFRRGGIRGFNREALRAGRAGAEAGGTRLIQGGQALLKNAGAIGRGETTMFEVWKNSVPGALDDAAEAAARSGADDLAEAAVKKGGAEIAESVAKEGTGVLAKASKMVDDFLGMISKKLGKAGSGLSGTFSKIGTRIGQAMKNSKVIGPLTAKLSTFFAATAGLAATVVGLAAKEITWISLGAVNGATAAKRLFFTDNIDGVMITISTAVGAALGTTPGSVVDIINEVVASILGFDIVSWLASELYKAIMHLAGKDDLANALTEGQEATKTNYEAYQNERIGSQYDAMIATGQLDPSVSREDYIAGAKAGQYKADYMSYVDYNDDVHKSGFAKISGAFKEAGDFWFGKKTTSYSDSTTGNRYVDNGDGTMTMYDASGNRVGNISKDAVDYKNMQSSTEKEGGVFSNIGNSIKTGIQNIGLGAGAIAELNSQIFKYASAGDLDGMKNFKLQGEDGESNPMVSATVGITKFFNYPIALVVAAGKKIKEGFTKLIKNVKEENNALNADNAMVIQNAGDGNLSALWEVGNGTRSGALGGIFSALLGVSKLFYSPGALFVSLGNKIANKFAEIKDSYDAMHGDLAANTAEVENLAAEGSIKDMWGVSMESQSGVFGWLGSASLTMAKLFNSPKAIFHAIGTKISDTFTNFKTAVSDDKATMDKSISSVWVDANNGKVTSIWNANMSLNKDDPLKFIWNIMFRVNQLAATLVGAFHYVGGAIRDKFNKASEDVKNFLSNTFGINVDTSTSGGGGARDGGYGIGGGRGGIPTTLNGHAYYSQNDPRWANVSYNGSSDYGTIGDSGCGPTAMSMVLSDIKNGNVSPTSLARFAQATGTRDSSGTNYNFIDQAASAYGVNATRMYHPSASDIVSSVASGNPMVLAGYGDSTSPYTAAGHYIVANGMDSSGNIKYSDPRGTEYSGTINPYDLAAHTNASWSFNGGRGGRGNRYLRFGNVADTSRNEGGYGYANSDCGFTARDIVGIAINELGYCGKTDHRYDYASGSTGAGKCSGGYGLVKYQTECGFPDGHWCNQFVYWLFKKAANNNVGNATKALCCTFGVPLTDQANSMRAAGQTIEKNFGLPKSGDIVFFWKKNKNRVGHVGIIEYVDGEIAHCIEGNYGNKVARTKHNWKEKLNTGEIYCIGRPRYDTTSRYDGNAGKIPAGADYLTNTYNGISEDRNVHMIDDEEYKKMSSDQRAAVMYSGLRSIGFSEMGAIGAMANMMTESSLLPERVEFDSSKSFPGYKALQDPNVMNDFTTNVLFPQYEKQGLSISRKAYSYNGSGAAPFYPGVGLIQWTGPRTKGLLDYANSNNLYWGSLATQLKYLALEAQGRKAGFDEVNAATNPDDAARAFAKRFEGTSYGMDKRRDAAKTFYGLLSSGVFNNAPSISTTGTSDSSSGGVLSKAGNFISRIGTAFSTIGSAIFEDLISGNLGSRDWRALMKEAFSGTSNTQSTNSYYDGFNTGDFGWTGSDIYESTSDNNESAERGTGISDSMNKLYNIAVAYSRVPSSMSSTFNALSPSEQAIVRMVSEKINSYDATTRSFLTHSPSEYWSWKDAYAHGGSSFTNSNTWNSLSQAEKDFVRELAGSGNVSARISTTTQLDPKYQNRTVESIAQHVFLGGADYDNWITARNKLSTADRAKFDTHLKFLQYITGRTTANPNSKVASPLYQWKRTNMAKLVNEVKRYPVLWEAVSNDELPDHYNWSGNNALVSAGNYTNKYGPDGAFLAGTTDVVPTPGGFGEGAANASINTSSKYALQSRVSKPSRSYTMSKPLVRSYHSGGFGPNDAGHYDYALNEIRTLLGVLVSNSNNLHLLENISANTSKFTSGGRGGNTIVNNNVVNNTQQAPVKSGNNSLVQGRGNNGIMTASEKVARAIAYGK